MLEILLNAYFGVNIFLLGGYFLQPFNTDTFKEKVGVFFLFFFFGGILLLWELIIFKIKSATKKN